MVKFLLAHAGTKLACMLKRAAIIKIALMISLLISGGSLFSQGTARAGTAEDVSHITSIAECNAKELAIILSIGSELIGNYYTALEELSKTERLFAYFSKKPNSFSPPGYAPSAYNSDLDMTHTELGAEIVKRIGNNSSNLVWIHENGGVSTKNGKKLRDILEEELENLETALDQADKALEENIKVIELIPPDYRYPLALQTMYSFVRNHRASNWKECADMTEEQLHRWKMEANSAEGLRLQAETRNLTAQVAKHSKKTARRAGATAVFTGIMAF